mmetsp:Transcript_11147/g.22204  ORF Transcript_11147/g.22204 Transcript_11147/m.22204 type:complete len:97 (-) Transcript_11147:539-829(-)
MSVFLLPSVLPSNQQCKGKEEKSIHEKIGNKKERPLDPTPISTRRISRTERNPWRLSQSRKQNCASPGPSKTVTCTAGSSPNALDNTKTTNCAHSG